jgi:hypothetical protein
MKAKLYVWHFSTQLGAYCKASDICRTCFSTQDLLGSTETHISLSCLHEHATGLYPKPEESNPHIGTLLAGCLDYAWPLHSKSFPIHYSSITPLFYTYRNWQLRKIMRIKHKYTKTATSLLHLGRPTTMKNASIDYEDASIFKIEESA